MITNLISPITHNSEALKGIRRSRFSFHLNTARRRRWLLVQLVSAPAIPTEEREDLPTTYVDTRPARPNLARLLEDYQMSRTQRQFV